MITYSSCVLKILLEKMDVAPSELGGEGLPVFPLPLLPALDEIPLTKLGYYRRTLSALLETDSELCKGDLLTVGNGPKESKGGVF
jgi:hypothetical protein